MRVKVRHGITPTSFLIPGRRPMRDHLATGNRDAHCGPQQGTSQLGRRESHAAALQMFPSMWAGMGNHLIKDSRYLPGMDSPFKNTDVAAAERHRGIAAPSLPTCPALMCSISLLWLAQWTHGPCCTPPGPKVQRPDSSVIFGKDRC